MKCRECGAEMRVGREDWPHPDLPGVTLRGVEVRRCVNDPEHEDVALPHVAELHRTLAGALLTKRSRLAGPEIRFLRELCGWDAAWLAMLLDVTPEVLFQWEGDQMDHPGVADRLIRLLAAGALGLPAPRDVLKNIGDAAAPLPLMLEFGPSAWRAVDESDPVSVWMSLGEPEREWVLEKMMGLLKKLESRRRSPGQGQVETGQTPDTKTGLPDGAYNPTDDLSGHEDADRALQVAVATLRALRRVA